MAKKFTIRLEDPRVLDAIAAEAARCDVAPTRFLTTTIMGLYAPTPSPAPPGISNRMDAWLNYSLFLLAWLAVVMAIAMAMDHYGIRVPTTTVTIPA